MYVYMRKFLKFGKTCSNIFLLVHAMIQTIRVLSICIGVSLHVLPQVHVAYSTFTTGRLESVDPREPVNNYFQY